MREETLVQDVVDRAPLVGSTYGHMSKFTALCQFHNSPIPLAMRVARSTSWTRYPSPAAALAVNSSPTPTTTIPMARATRLLFDARRSAVIAAVTSAITRRSITPMTRRIAVKAAQL